MAIRSEVLELQNISPLPSEDEATPDVVEPYEKLIRAIKPPITDEEASLLVDVFGNDGCFGLAASLVQRIETAPQGLALAGAGRYRRGSASGRSRNFEELIVVSFLPGEGAP